MRSRRSVQPRGLAVASALVLVLAGCGGDADPQPDATTAASPTLGTATEQLADLMSDVQASGGTRFERIDATEVLGSEEEFTTVTTGVVDRLARLARTTTTRSGTSAEVIADVLPDPTLVDLEVASVVDNSGPDPTIYLQLSGVPQMDGWGDSWWRIDPPLKAGQAPEIQIADPIALLARVLAFATLDPVAVDEATVTVEIEAPPSLAVQLLPSEIALRLSAAGIGAGEFTSMTRGTASIVDGELHVSVVITDLVREAGDLLADVALVASTQSADQVVRFVLAASPSGETVDPVPSDKIVPRRPA